MQTDNPGAAFALSERPASLVAKTLRATWVGLFLALFAMVIVRQVFVFFAPEMTFASAILKELLIWTSAAALLIIIRCGEHLPVRSIGLGTTRWWKSVVGD
jgi:hypothetical protein